MKNRVYFGIVALLALSLFVFAGCAKKTTTTTPPETKVEVKDDSQWTPPPTEPKVDEAALAAEAEARAKTEAVEELSSITIHFAFDSYELNEESRATLALKASIMRKYTDVGVVVEGHCDERGTEEYNLALGERRARAAYEHLVILGVEPERMKIVSFGEERPLDPAHNESAWAKNRRAEFVVQ
ncbi:peptidoglycan-associated lipoprotein [Pseudodesulfovibrio nedwellii]|uniref:Peptidoglycan-associated lipoprotein n=1 Tax=Pseudodesulfovibrio nedwellii TaxID=2973072 RepID=A0ABN6S0F0_9BACT|nr:MULTISPECIES: peptidoglycan-associated lipoprotein Pal [Pseudodesulfovibrio]BDQ36419.1 peptidoglycan-associated lipoprotein [Pseudodesulfovibrio nedwellii]